MELDLASATMRDDGALLIVDQDFGRAAAEPFEGAYHSLVGMLGVLGVGRPDSEPTLTDVVWRPISGWKAPPVSWVRPTRSWRAEEDVADI